MIDREKDMALKLVHTADWHLGKRFRAFGDREAERLAHARLEVLDQVFAVADAHQVDAVLCAGDLFDDPKPSEAWWRGLARKLEKTTPGRPIFLLPGNHDALVAGSVWEPTHPLRKLLPPHVTVIDHERFERPLNEHAVLYAEPCLSTAGQSDPALALPTRAPGDERIRVGLVHGSTFDLENWQANFPIAKDAAVQRGLDYLAIGDTHGFRRIPDDPSVPPTVYPSAPEQTSFGERDAGHVALVFVRKNRKVELRKHRVGHWYWETHRVESMDALRALAAREDLGQRVLQLSLDLRVSAAEYAEAERLLTALAGTEADAAKVGVLKLDRSGLVLDTRDVEALFADMPESVREAARKLQAREREPAEAQAASRALYHLYTLMRRAG